VANFAEVFLARNGHGHPAGGQLREEAPDVAAGVDYVRIGRADPAPLDDFAEGLRWHLPVDVAGEGEPALTARFDPGSALARHETVCSGAEFLRADSPLAGPSGLSVSVGLEAEDGDGVAGERHPFPVVDVDHRVAAVPGLEADRPGVGPVAAGLGDEPGAK